MSQNGTNERISAAVFRAETNVELRHLWRQIDLLWEHNAKRRAEIEAIRARFDSAVIAGAALACGLLFKLLGLKLGL